jgi:hypothetical protein
MPSIDGPHNYRESRPVQITDGSPVPFATKSGCLVPKDKSQAGTTPRLQNKVVVPLTSSNKKTGCPTEVP